jgi:hypothetical protein
MCGFLTVRIVFKTTTSDLPRDMKSANFKAKKINLRLVVCVMSVCSKLKLVYSKREMNSVSVPYVKLKQSQKLFLFAKNQKEKFYKIYWLLAKIKLL